MTTAEKDFWDLADKIYPSRDRVAQYLSPLARLYSPKRMVADLACGRGEMLSMLRQQGHHVIGVDTSPQSERWAVEVGFPFHKMDVLEFLEAPPVPYDALFCYGFLEHLNGAAFLRLFKTMGRRCPAGTEVLFATHDPGSLQAHLKPLYGDVTHERLYSEELVRASFEEHGFRIKGSGAVQQSESLIPASALTPEESLKFRSAMNDHEGQGTSWKQGLRRAAWRDKNTDAALRYVLGRLHVIESTLQSVAAVFNKPMDYYVFAVKEDARDGS